MGKLLGVYITHRTHNHSGSSFTYGTERVYVECGFVDYGDDHYLLLKSDMYGIISEMFAHESVVRVEFDREDDYPQDKVD